MEHVKVDLLKASDASDSHAIKLQDGSGGVLAQTGYGQDFERVWTVEFEARYSPDILHVDWDAVLQRVIEAHAMSDPVITGFRWPQQEKV